MQLAAPVGTMKRILCSDWLPGQARWGPTCPLGISRYDPVQGYKFRGVDFKSSHFFGTVGDGVAKSGRR